MAIFDLFSKRQKRLRGEVPDVYTYDDIPQTFRTQVILLWRDIDPLGHYFQHMVKILCKEYGMFRLCDAVDGLGYRNYEEELARFFYECTEAEQVLDVIELAFKFIQIKCGMDQPVEELNLRFKEHGIGYQFEGRIVRVDSQLVHQEAVKPALTLLSSSEYAGAQQEFLSAYEHYRQGKHKEAMNDALKAFESTLKVICTKRKWKFNATATASKLLDICYQNELIPAFWQSHMTGLRATLEGGVPTGRNKTSAHGQGAVPTNVPDHLVSYVLHMTASTIVFLVKAEQKL